MYSFAVSLIFVIVVNFPLFVGGLTVLVVEVCVVTVTLYFVSSAEWIRLSIFCNASVAEFLALITTFNEGFTVVGGVDVCLSLQSFQSWIYLFTSLICVSYCVLASFNESVNKNICFVRLSIVTLSPASLTVSMMLLFNVSLTVIV